MKLSNKFEYKNKVIKKSSNLVIYKEATLLVSGVYADSATNRFTNYPKKVIERYAKNWKSNFLSLDHSKDVLKRIGKIKNPKYKDGKLVGDLYIYTVTSVAKDVVKLIDSGLINWMSVEVNTKDKYNYEMDLMEVKEMEFVGASVVSLPACPNAKIISNGTDIDDVYYE